MGKYNQQRLPQLSSFNSTIFKRNRVGNTKKGDGLFYSFNTETNRLVSYDFYQNSMTLYRNCRFLSEENVPGTKLIFDDWSAFFDNSSNKPSENSTK
jgi:hypothetical protein